MMTLFRIATMEAWTNLVYINYYGCDSQNLMVEGVSCLYLSSPCLS